MSESERATQNSEPPLSQDEVALLRGLVSGKSDNRGRFEVGAELHGINQRLDLMQRVFMGTGLVVMACFGFFFLKTMEISVSIGKIESRFDAVGERFGTMDERFKAVDQRFDGIDKRLDTMEGRFDGVDKRLDTITSLLTSSRIQQRGLLRE